MEIEIDQSVYFRSVGQNIRSRRKELPLTQQQLSDKLRIAQPMVSRYEQGIQHMSLDMLIRISKALDSNLDIQFKLNISD